jgi:hypothetical protein
MFVYAGYKFVPFPEEDGSKLLLDVGHFYQTARHHISECGILLSHRCQELKSRDRRGCHSPVGLYIKIYEILMLIVTPTYAQISSVNLY